jgi:hypothetical protein
MLSTPRLSAQMSANEAERQGATDMTMALDGWSTQRMESVMGWVLRMCDGHVQVWI